MRSMTNLSFRPTRPTRGFTLIELVIVIVILGIVAAVAVPRFLDLRSQARTAQLQGVFTATQSATTIAFAACPQASCAPGEFITTHYGYPNATEPGIVRMLIRQGVRFTGGGTQINLRSGEMTSNLNGCRVRYIRANAPGERPQIDLFTSAC